MFMMVSVLLYSTFFLLNTLENSGPTISFSFQPLHSVANKKVQCTIYQLENSMQYCTSIVVGGTAWLASSEVNKADGGESDEVYFQDHVLPITFIARKNDMRVHYTYLFFAFTI